MKKESLPGIRYRQAKVGKVFYTHSFFLSVTLMLPQWSLLVGALLALVAGGLWVRRYRAAGPPAPGRRSPRTSPLPNRPAAAQQPGHGSAPIISGPTAGEVAHLVGLLAVPHARAAAADQLVWLGASGLPVLRHALGQEMDEWRLKHLAAVCSRLATPEARQLLVEAAQTGTLPARAAALRALASFEPVPADAPLFFQLIDEEMQLAQQLVHGMAAIDAELREALRYELQRGLQRVFGALLQVYARPIIQAAQRGATHPAPEQQAQALHLLDHLLPRPLCEGLQAWVDGRALPAKMQTFDDLLGPPPSAESIQALIARRGAVAFSAWTISLALRQWHPQPGNVAYLQPHLQSDSRLVRESATALLRQLPVQRPAAYDQLLAHYPTISSVLMIPPNPAAYSSAHARVQLLKGMALFAETPGNILAIIEPIMQEVAFAPAQEIFGKGTLGTSLFIVCEGEVGIFDGTRQLVTFRKGDFFGELALLDTEPRSATAVAQGPVVTFRLDQEDFYSVMEERPEVLRSILRVLCQRLRRQNEQTQ